MIINLVGPFIVNAPFGTEIAFAKGLRRIGQTVIECDPNLDAGLTALREDAHATIVFKSCVGNELALNRLVGKHLIIVYQPDDARFPHIQNMVRQMRPYADLFLSFDQYGTDFALGAGYRAAQTLLLTADDELYCPSPNDIERDIDVSFIGSMGDPVAHASRRRMCEIVEDEGKRRGWKTVFGSTQDIPTILNIYRRSKIVLNHATDVGQPFGEGYGIQCRHFEVGMTRTCLISNSRPLSFLMNHLSSPYDFFSEETLIRNVNVVLTHSITGLGSDVDIPLYEALGIDLYNEIRNSHLPEHRAKQLVDFITQNS